MAKYSLTNRAVEDLSAIWNYTYEVWSEAQADNYFALLIDASREISETPDIGKTYDKIEANVLGFRVGKHIIFYRILQFREIEVLRILYGRMDLKNRMDE